MAKKRAGWNRQIYEKRLKEGRGQGERMDYKPWLTIHDFASRGYAVRIKGMTIPREYHLMSHLERDYFICTDWNEKVSDIREQYPLRLQDTLSIADETGIRHPTDPVSGFPIVMTTDFLITTEDGLLARTVKPSGDLSKPRVLEKFEIERRYWKRKGIDWKIVTEKQISSNKALNIRWLCGGIPAEMMIRDKALRDDCTGLFMELFREIDIPFHEIIRVTEQYGNLEPGSALSIYKKLVRTGQIPFDYHAAFDLEKQAAYGRKAYI